MPACVFTNTYPLCPPSAPLAFLSLFARQFRTHTARPALYYTTTTAPTLYTTIFYDFVKSMKNVDGFPLSLDSCSRRPPPPPLVRRVFVGVMEEGTFFPSILILSFARFFFFSSFFVVGSKISLEECKALIDIKFEIYVEMLRASRR